MQYHDLSFVDQVSQRQQVADGPAQYNFRGLVLHIRARLLDSHSRDS